MLLICMRNYSHCDYYYELMETLDELNFYQPLVLNLKMLQRYHEELAMAKFLSSLDTFFGNSRTNY